MLCWVLKCGGIGSWKVLERSLNLMFEKMWEACTQHDVSSKNIFSVEGNLPTEMNNHHNNLIKSNSQWLMINTCAKCSSKLNSCLICFIEFSSHDSELTAGQTNSVFFCCMPPGCSLWTLTNTRE